ncbi:M13 family metallopeptidase [Streptococcus pneumoniae]
MKKRNMWLTLTSLLVLGTLSACQTTNQADAAKTKVDTKATVQSNFYQTINKEWLEKAEIPDDKPVYNAPLEIQEEIDQQLKTDSKEMAEGKRKVTDSYQAEMIKLYQKAMDFDQREKDGAKEALSHNQELEKLSSFKELSKESKNWILKGNPLPFSISIGSNPENTSQKMINLGVPSSILPDVSYYQNEATKKQLLDLYQTSVLNTLKLYGFDDKKAKNLVEKAIEFDALIVPYLPSSEEVQDVKKTINPRTIQEINAYAPQFAIGDLVTDLVGQKVDTVNVTWPAYYENLGKLIDDKNFEAFKAWIVVNDLMESAQFLTDDLREAASSFGLALSGQKELPSREDNAYYLATGMFSNSLSVYYNQEYFSPKAKQQVTEMVTGIVNSYKERLAKNDWLSEDTKSEAIKKLDHLRYYIGGPENVNTEASELKIEDNQSLYQNLLRLSQETIQTSFAEFSKPIDKNLWVAPSYQVNAFYSPETNSIYLPAAILQAPFYDEKQSLAANYGGIGAVIGHEISHAFDTNGAEFDENGNRRNWWTEKDQKAFEEKTKAMIKEFDGLEIYGNKVNGQLTVTENTADAGGISVALQVLQEKDAKADLKPFFENWATVWRQISTEQFAQLVMATDPHAPNELRANVQVKNIDAFYDTYKIKEGDGMYLAPEKRVRIW